MGAVEYGAFAYSITWVQLLILPAGIGLPIASVRFLSEYSASGAWSKVRGLIGRSFLLITAMSIAISIVASITVLVIGDRVPTVYRTPLLIAFAGLPVFAWLALGTQIGRSFGWVVVAYLPSQVLHPVLLLGIAAAFIVVGQTLSARTLLIAAILTATLCALGQAAIYASRLRPKLRNVAPQHEQRAWLRVAAPLLLIDGFSATITFADILMVGIFLDPSAVAYYVAATRTAALVTFFASSSAALMGPRIAELNSQARMDAVQELLRGMLPWIAIPATIATLVVIAGGPFLLALFGKGFEAGWPVLILLAIGHLMLSINGPAGLLLTMTGHQDIAAKAFGVAAVANVILNAVLIPSFGLIGAAAATLISTCAMSTWLAFLAQRTLSVRTGLWAMGQHSRD